jgi:N-acyl-D-amino-acid deacylase
MVLELHAARIGPWKRRRPEGIRAFMFLLAVLEAGASCAGPKPLCPVREPSEFDVILQGGNIIDGTGLQAQVGDVGIIGERIGAVGNLGGCTAKDIVDAKGLVVSPGFIDMLGQSEVSLLVDNRSFSKLSQGITGEITGEGGSIAPQNNRTFQNLKETLDRQRLDYQWQTLDEYFKLLEKRGTPLNLGTYVGAGQIREVVLGSVDRAPSPAELRRMKLLVSQAMEAGAMGLSTALIYTPDRYATTAEIIELARVAGQYGGLYASHIRSEGQAETSALKEAFQIAREAKLPLEIFHLKVVGKARWGSMPEIVSMIQAARDSGLDVTADMYPYLAGMTELSAMLPPWVAEGGTAKLLQRLRNPSIRSRLSAELTAEHSSTGENLYLGAGGAEGIIISQVWSPSLTRFAGKTLAEVASLEHKRPLEALYDLILEDGSRTTAIFFVASEEDLQYGIKQSWTSLSLDAAETSQDGPLFDAHGHPRAFGTMPRFLGHYVRDLHLVALEEAVRKITGLPAAREHLSCRGLVRRGYYADLTVFNPLTIDDRATYANPTMSSTGIEYVFVNGKLEYEHGKLTGIASGQILRGRGWHQHLKDKPVGDAAICQ